MATPPPCPSLSPPASPAVITPSTILGWYDARRPRCLDLVGDYAGQEHFLIEGDSLLRHCFGDSRIDYQQGWQMLHAVYVVEQFIGALIKRHCRFSLAFFTGHERLCVPAGVPNSQQSKFLLTRAVLIRHLNVHLPSSSGVQIHIFPSLSSDEFKQFLVASPIHFIMAHDGSLPATGNVRNKLGADRSAKVLFQGNIWLVTSLGLSVALINRVEFRDSKVFTLIIEAGRHGLHPGFDRLMAFTWNSFINHDPKTLDADLPFDISLLEAELQVIIASAGTRIPESWFLIACSISRMLLAGASNVLASAFAMHVLLIEYLSLSQRRLPLVTFGRKLESEVEDFLQYFATVSMSFLADPGWLQAIKNNDITCDLVDMVDGRLFRVVLHSCLEGLLQEQLPNAIREQWLLVAEAINSMSGRHLSLEDIADSGIKYTAKQDNQVEVNVGEAAVMLFSNPVFDKHLACIHVTAEATPPSHWPSMRLYRETTHWHNHRMSLNYKKPLKQKITKWRNPLRLNQLYMAGTTLYAASLTGAKGNLLRREIITVGPKKLLNAAEETPGQLGKSFSKPNDSASIPKKGGKKAVAGLSKAQQIIADNNKKKGTAEADKAFSAWASVLKTYSDISSDEERYWRTKSYLDDLDPAKSAHVEADINAYLLHTLLLWWASYCKVQMRDSGYHIAALIWTVVRTICSSRVPITKEINRHVEKVCKLLGIPDAMDKLTVNAPDRKLSFVFTYPLNTQDLEIGMPQSSFQLMHCGPYMDRNLDAQPDPRVSFTPDGWQRKVLDELDANHSVFVVAPTSAGKTFISFYAMEKVLRADNDGVLVYVAPTKALVNQIAAEIEGRFSKKYPQAMGGKSVWAIHTRDYRINSPIGCQILVTVPHILQIMLLSSVNARTWAPRVKTIIFDEIHSIGQSDDGVVWEQLLLLAPCPIIALSATVGNPSQFNDWLAETQRATGTKLTMIQHTTRYSDLRKYMYNPPQGFKFEGLGKSQGARLGIDALEGLTYLHPVASLVDRSRGMPDDLALEPRDCFTLWVAMCQFQNDKYTVPAPLDPINALPKCIRKIDIFKWEKELKKILLLWMLDRDSPFDKLIEALRVHLIANESPGASDSEQVDSHDLRATTLPLLLKLHQGQALPAILFNYDRSGCEDIGQALLQQLEAAENKWKLGKEWQRKLDGWAKWKDLKEKRVNRKPPKTSKERGNHDDERGSKADQIREDASSEISSYDLFDPDEPLDDFSFADKRRCQKKELDEFTTDLRVRHIKEDLIKLLQRGIGIHHAGMNRKYRQLVEILFRRGFLRVVIATGTLSLGINMPCATVVFSGDSVFLTALNFRQASGRSGRRGFDLLGNVVFQGISLERACRLLSSRLPDLVGHFPVTTTLVLRLFTLLHDSNNSPYAVKAINSLLSQPRLYLGGESFKEQVLHHLRFSIEYLRRQSLLGPNGQPANFTSCVSHLYFTENSSFAFHALLKNGYFSFLCKDIHKNREQVMRTMMLVLSHIFGRQICREASQEEKEKIRRSQSIVYLPPLPARAAKVLRRHNDNTLAIFATYVKTFAAQHLSSEECSLPFTGVPVGSAAAISLSLNDERKAKGKDCKNSNASNRSEAVDDHNAITFLPSLPTPKARSPFVALSGHGDNFTTIGDLCSSTRTGIFLESAVIPHIELYPDESRVPLNAYLLDFFSHGAVQPLEEANGIRRSDIWFWLNDFSLVLATIVTSLANYLGSPGELVGDAVDDGMLMLDVMGSGDSLEIEGDEQMAAETIPSVPTDSGHASKVARKTKGKIVADEWDQEDDNTDDDCATNEWDSDDSNDSEDSDYDDSSDGIGAASETREYKRLFNVYIAFQRLKAEFDAKFRAIWA